MTKKRSTNLSGETKTSFIFPHLNQEVADAVSDHITSVWFNRKINQESDQRYSTFVMGRFTCDNGGCSKAAWSSGKVTIVIRGYPDNGYNAVVYNQRCKACKKLGTLTLDENSYVERVAYRLKKWAGVDMERPVYSKKETPPHKRELCEGCKSGYCEASLYSARI
ncbi:cytochrome p450 [Colletotrichum asianum]